MKEKVNEVIEHIKQHIAENPTVEDFVFNTTLEQLEEICLRCGVDFDEFCIKQGINK